MKVVALIDRISNKMNEGKPFDKSVIAMNELCNLQIVFIPVSPRRQVFHAIKMFPHKKSRNL